MSLPKFLQPYVPSYDVSSLDKSSPGVAGEIITQVLNLGDSKAVIWIFDNYTLDEIRSVVKKPQKGVWNEESLNYWKEILKIDKVSGYNAAIINVRPV
jgi:hypothetical protein